MKLDRGPGRGVRRRLVVSAAALALAACGGPRDEASLVQVQDYALTPLAYGPKCGFVDARGKLVISPQFDAAGRFLKRSGLAPVKVGAKWGLVDKRGRFAVTPQFDRLLPSGDGETFWVQVANRWGTIDRKGAFVINPRFDAYVGDFDARGRAVVGVGGKQGVVDRKGEFIIPAAFDAIAVRALPRGREQIFSGGLALARLNGKWGYLDEKGAWTINPQFVDAGWFDANGLAAVAVAPAPAPAAAPGAAAPAAPAGGNRWGYIDRKGAFVIQPQFSMAGQFEGAKLAPVKVGDVWGYVDRKGDFVVNPQFVQAFPFRKGPGGLLARVAVRSGAGQRWALIDPKGGFRVPPQFDGLGDFDDNGRALAAMGDQWGLVDERGRFAVNPMYATLAPVAGSKDYAFTRAVPMAAVAEAAEIGRIDRSGKMLGSVSGVACPRQ